MGASHSKKNTSNDILYSYNSVVNEVFQRNWSYLAESGKNFGAASADRQSELKGLLRAAVVLEDFLNAHYTAEREVLLPYFKKNFGWTGFDNQGGMAADNSLANIFRQGTPLTGEQMQQMNIRIAAINSQLDAHIKAQSEFMTRESLQKVPVEAQQKLVKSHHKHLTKSIPSQERPLLTAVLAYSLTEEERRSSEAFPNVWKRQTSVEQWKQEVAPFRPYSAAAASSRITNNEQIETPTPTAEEHAVPAAVLTVTQNEMSASSSGSSDAESSTPAEDLNNKETIANDSPQETQAEPAASEEIVLERRLDDLPTASPMLTAEPVTIQEESPAVETTVVEISAPQPETDQQTLAAAAQLDSILAEFDFQTSSIMGPTETPAAETSEAPAAESDTQTASPSFSKVWPGTTEESPAANEEETPATSSPSFTKVWAEPTAEETRVATEETQASTEEPPFSKVWPEATTEETPATMEETKEPETTEQQVVEEPLTIQETSAPAPAPVQMSSSAEIQQSQGGQTTPRRKWSLSTTTMTPVRQTPITVQPAAKPQAAVPDPAKIPLREKAKMFQQAAEQQAASIEGWKKHKQAHDMKPTELTPQKLSQSKSMEYSSESFRQPLSQSRSMDDNKFATPATESIVQQEQPVEPIPATTLEQPAEPTPAASSSVTPEALAAAAQIDSILANFEMQTSLNSLNKFSLDATSAQDASLISAP